MRSEDEYGQGCGARKGAINRVRAQYSRHRSIWDEYCHPETHQCGTEPSPYAPDASEASVRAYESCIEDFRRRQERRRQLAGSCDARQEAMQELAEEFREEHRRLCERGCEDLEPLSRGGEPRRCASADALYDLELSPTEGRRRRR